MSELEEIKKEITQIKKRNKRVEADKAWETSFFRIALIAVLTYIVIVLFFFAAGLPKPFINPIVPTVGFVLSTLTVPAFKKYWIKNRDK
jgi:amino acid permease